MRAHGTRAPPVAGAPPGPAHRGAAGRPGTAQEGAADASAGGTGSCAGPGGKGWQGSGTDGPAFHGSGPVPAARGRSEEHTSELQSQSNLVCRLLLEKKTPDS